MFNITINSTIHVYAKYFITFLSIWKLDSFRSFYTLFCIHPRLSALQVLTLSMLSHLSNGIVLLTFLLIKLRNQYPFLVWLCKPFCKCLHYFKKEWYFDSSSSIIESFALLSFVKILNVSIDILATTYNYNMDGEKSMFIIMHHFLTLGKNTFLMLSSPLSSPFSLISPPYCCSAFIIPLYGSILYIWKVCLGNA